MRLEVNRVLKGRKEKKRTWSHEGGGGGGGDIESCDAKTIEKCLCSYNNCTALIKISMFDTALVMTNTYSFNPR